MPNNYDVAFAAIRIMDTRSRGKDTLWIKINVAVDDVGKGTVNWDGSFSHEEGKAPRAGRDFNNGYFDGIRNANGNGIVGTQTGPITDNSIVKVTFLVLNSGHSPNEENYSKGLAELASRAAASGTIWGDIAAGILKGISVLIGANCDGPVAADSVKFRASEIREKLEGHPQYYNWESGDYRGKDKPAGCSPPAESCYRCTIQFTYHK